MDDVSPVDGKAFCQVARSTKEDVELALDAAHAARVAWGETSLTDRAKVLNMIADVLEANLTMLAVAESYENGKPVRETLAADLPLAIDHFRYFAGATRSLEAVRPRLTRTRWRSTSTSRSCRGTDHPVQLPAPHGGVEDRSGSGRGQLHRAQARLPNAVVNSQVRRVARWHRTQGRDQRCHRSGAEIGKALATSPRIAKIGFTGETTTGRLIMQYAAQNLIPSTVELGGKSPNIFFADVMNADDEFLDKAIEGLVLYAFNKGEVCTCPSRALIQESIYDKFMERCLARIAKITQGNRSTPAP